MPSRATTEIMKDDRPHRALLSGSSTKKENHGTPYVKDVTKVLRSHVAFGGEEDIMFLPE